MHDLEKIYNEYFSVVNKYLFCLTHNNDISEDLTQETFCKAVQYIDSYKGECKISVWLCQIAKNLWYNQYKKNNKLIFDSENNDLMYYNDFQPIENAIISQEEKNLLYKKIQNLEKNSREVLYLRIQGELSFKEISLILNKTETWARVTFYRAKKKMIGDDYNENI